MQLSVSFQSAQMRGTHVRQTPAASNIFTQHRCEGGGAERVDLQRVHHALRWVPQGLPKSKDYLAPTHHAGLTAPEMRSSKEIAIE